MEHLKSISTVTDIHSMKFCCHLLPAVIENANVSRSANGMIHLFQEEVPVPFFVQPDAMDVDANDANEKDPVVEIDALFIQYYSSIIQLHWRQPSLYSGGASYLCSAGLKRKRGIKRRAPVSIFVPRVSSSLRQLGDHRCSPVASSDQQISSRQLQQPRFASQILQPEQEQFSLSMRREAPKFQLMQSGKFSSQTSQRMPSISRAQF
uniref:Uncharacterized protein n=1 Tax=Ditylenchus dipsaci TaxID=166011 RepID=A0A915E7F8_9BILA